MSIEAKHKKPCGACKTSGRIPQKILNRKTGKIEIHYVTCGSCGGSGYV